ncbi:MAG: hypothetical protein ACI9PN_002692, partial [Candidatus Azotimanducaceae bacterium]
FISKYRASQQRHNRYRGEEKFIHGGVQIDYCYCAYNGYQAKLSPEVLVPSFHVRRLLYLPALSKAI